MPRVHMEVEEEHAFVADIGLRCMLGVEHPVDATPFLFSLTVVTIFSEDDTIADDALEVVWVVRCFPVAIQPVYVSRIANEQHGCVYHVYGAHGVRVFIAEPTVDGALVE